MQGKTVVITGATSGIGEVAALALAAKGARIVLVARDKLRGEATLARLAARAPGLDHKVHYADLSRLSEMRRVAAEIAAQEPRIDVLMNNAGALFNHRIETEDGLEMTFATNHMSYFVLTEGLRARLEASAPARIVNTASNAHRGAGGLDFADLQMKKNYLGMRAYARSKLCNILYTRELARRLHGSGVSANCLHPGFVATRFGDQSGGILGSLMGPLKLFAISPQKGAETMIFLASAPEAAAPSGQYYDKCRVAVPTRAARDDEAAARLWQASEALALVPA